MARKQPPGAAIGAGPAPRPRGHRSLVTKRDLQAYRRRLEAELAELRGQRAEEAPAAGAGAAGTGTGADLAGVGEEPGVAAGFRFQRGRDLSAAGPAGEPIGRVEHALARLEAGRFGRCEACGRPIEAERLDALPYATLCLADARRRVGAR